MKKMRFVLAGAGLLSMGMAFAQTPVPSNTPGVGFGPDRPPMERALGPRDSIGRWWNHPALVEKLKLTEVQRRAMDKISMEHRATLIDLHANLQKAELAMEPLMGEETPNEAKILAAIDKVAQSRAELEKANARFLLALRAKLTPEQWKTMEADRLAHRGFGPEGRRGPHGAARDGQPPLMPPPEGGPQMHTDDGPESDGPGAPPEAAHAPGI